MRFDLAISALGVTVFAVGLVSVAAQSRTSFSGLDRRTSSDTCAVVNGPFKVSTNGVGPVVTVGFIGAYA